MGYIWLNELGKIIIDVARPAHGHSGKISVERTMLHFPETENYSEDAILNYDARVFWGMKPKDQHCFYENQITRLSVICDLQSEKVRVESFEKEIFDNEVFTHSVSLHQTYGRYRKGVYQLAFPPNCYPKSIRTSEDVKLVHADIYNDEYVVLTWIFNGELDLLAIGSHYARPKKIDKSALFNLPEFVDGIGMDEVSKAFKKVSGDPSVIKAVLETIAKLFL